MQALDYLKIDNNGPSKKSIVFIHGWKGNKNSFKTLPSILKINNASWFFPQAPYKVNGGKDAYTWAYQKQKGDWEQKESKILLKEFIEKIVLSKFDSKQVFFIGFSQGATVCYEFLFSLKYPWGGIFPVAGFFRNFKKGITLNDIQKKTIIYIGHGIKDNVIPLESSERSYQFLLKNDYNVYFEKYKGGHKISLDYLKKISIIINKSNE